MRLREDRAFLRTSPPDFWPENFPDTWRRMELRRHRCGEIVAYDRCSCGEWFHPAYHAASGFAARSSGFGARCPRKGCGRGIYPVGTERVPREDQPPLFD